MQNRQMVPRLYVRLIEPISGTMYLIFSEAVERWQLLSRRDWQMTF